MNRRTFLTFSGLGAAAFSMANVKVLAISTEEAVSGIIQNELGYLNLDKMGLEGFVKDYLKEDTYTSHLHTKVKYYHFFGIDSTKSSVVKALVNRYIFSTDFFRNGMDKDKPVKYLGLYDPYKTPCVNPFSSLYYSDQNT